MEIDTVVCGDCLNVMAEMDDKCVDLLYADPPYDMGFWEWVDGWIEKLPRILKPNASIYISCGIGERSDSFTRIISLVKDNFTFKNFITWKKQRGYGTQRNWMYTREEIIFAVNGPEYKFHPQYTSNPRTLMSGGSFKRNQDNHCKSPYKRCSNVWIDIKEISRLGGIRDSEWLQIHPTQKPEALLTRIILASSDKGDLIFDPFIGSGTTAVAAIKSGRHFYGCDINPEYVDISNKRIVKTRLEMAQMKMF